MKRSTLILAVMIGFGYHGARGAESKVDFVKDIQPILQKTCIECHGPEKQKGKLRLDSKEAAFKGGADGPAIVPNNPEKSDLYRRITLPAGHDDIMPNKGEPLTKVQTDLIRDWISQGAVWPDTAVVKASGEASAEQAKMASHTPTAGELKAVAELEASGISVRPIAMNVNWRQAGFHLLGSNVTDKTLSPLKSILGLVDLNLAGTKITDAGLPNIQGLTNLARLHLEKTDITDAGLVYLKGLVGLSYLNLYSTAVTDSGLEHLKGLTNLKHLYLWQTKVTDAGATNLQKALPKLDISRGWDLQAAAKPAEAKPPEKEEAKKQ
jgi:mono/diheme cytochrome c family protein